MMSGVPDWKNSFHTHTTYGVKSFLIIPWYYQAYTKLPWKGPGNHAMNNQRTTSPLKKKAKVYVVCKVTHCAGCISANTRPPQLHWDNREMGTTISCANTVRGLASSRRLVELSFSEASSLHAAVLHVAVFCLKTTIVIQAINNSMLPSICYNVFIPDLTQP